MNGSFFRYVPAVLVTVIILAARPASASISTYAGNGGDGFEGFVGNGSLTVADDGSGGVDFSFTLSGTGTWNDLAGDGNDLVIYLDNGTGGGIAPDTSAIYDGTSDSGKEAVTENNGAGSDSILNFSSLMAPQYAIDFLSGYGGYGQIFQINQGSDPNFIDGTAANTTGSSGISYTVSGGTASLDLPSVDFGLGSYSGATLNFVAIEVSETGYSSDEATVDLTGTQGYGNTQYLDSVNTFTTAVPEGSTAGLVACGAGLLLAWKRGRGPKATPL